MNNTLNEGPQRYPDVGRLGVAILENLVEKVIGDSAIEEIKKPYAQKEIADSLGKALARVEKGFIAQYSDKRLCDVLLQLPLQSLPTVREALWEFYERPNDTGFQYVLANQMSSLHLFDARNIENAVDFYVRLLRRELICINSDVLNKIQALALLNIEDKLSELLKERPQPNKRRKSKSGAIMEIAQLSLDVGFEDFDEAERQSWISSLARLLRVNTNNIQLSRILPQNILEFTMDIPSLMRLFSLIKQQNDQLKKIGVSALQLSNGKKISMKSNTQQDIDFEEDYKHAIKAFDDLLQDERVWILSLVDVAERDKGDFLSWLATKRCQSRPCSLLSLELYVSNIGGLLFALIESPSIRTLIPKDVFQSFKTDNSNAILDLSRKPMSIGGNDVNAPVTGDLTQSTNIEVDPDQIGQLVQNYSEFYSEIRISESWLSTISTTMLNETNPRMIFLFDDYDLFEGSISLRDRNLFWEILWRAHNLVPGLRVVIGSMEVLQVPEIWRKNGEVKAFYL